MRYLRDLRKLSSYTSQAAAKTNDESWFDSQQGQRLISLRTSATNAVALPALCTMCTKGLFARR